MSGDLAAAIAQANANTGAMLRTGVLKGITGSTVTVDIAAGQLVDIPYLSGYTPLLGDVVQVLQYGAVTLCLGGVAGMPDGNVVINPSFELDPPGTTSITGWTFTPDPAYAGSQAHLSYKVDVGSGWGALDGSQWLEYIYHDDSGTGTGGNGNMIATSSAIPVQPGDVWSAYGYCITLPDPGPRDYPSLQVSLTFYASPTDNYPSTVAESEQQYISGATGPLWVPVRAISGTGTIVPAGATSMRVTLDTTLGSGSAYWDKIVCVKLN
jgi:hypothetical protein